METINQTKQPERLYYLDWLRVLAFGLLFVFHSARFFDDFGWHVKNEEHSMLANIFVGFTHGWRMHLIFFISGVGTYFAIRSRKGAFVRDRFTRLIVPYLFGVILLIPPQKFYEGLHQNWFNGRFSEFIFAYPSGLMEHAPGASLEWTGLFGLHIWYLAFLFAMTLAYLPLMKALAKPTILSNSLKVLSRKLIGLFVFVIPVIITEALLRPRYGEYLSWADFFQYSMFFLVGYVFMIHENFRSLVRKYTYLLLVIAIISSGYTLAQMAQGIQGETGLIAIIYSTIQIISSYSWVLFFFGLSQRKLNFNNKYLNSLNTGVLPFYILHQTVIIMIGFYVVSLDLSMMSKFLIILTTSLISTILLYQLIRRVNALRFVFGMKKLNKK
jgi:glucans biosynthesis protein C